MITYCTVVLGLVVLVTFFALLQELAKNPDKPEPPPKPETPKPGLYYVVVTTIVGAVLLGEGWAIYLLWR